MKNPAVSIIIPVYNSEAYLERLLESVLTQTFQDFEVLIVDDGSTDSSPSILHAFSQKDSRIHLFFQSHLGPSVARNKGIEQAKGDFISFVDSDDYLDNDYYESFFSEGNDYDIIFQGYMSENSLCTEMDRIIPEFKIVKKGCCNDIVYYLRKKKLLGWTWIKLIRRSLILEHNIRFNPDIMWREDSLFAMQICEHIHSICIIPQCHYHYCLHNGSLSHSDLSSQKCYLLGKLMWKASTYLRRHPQARLFEEQYFLNILKKSLFLSYKQREDASFRKKVICEIKSFVRKHPNVYFLNCSYTKSRILFYLFKFCNTSFINYVLTLESLVKNIK